MKRAVDKTRYARGPLFDKKVYTKDISDNVLNKCCR
jgi:hypothetical protein